MRNRIIFILCLSCSVYSLAYGAVPTDKYLVDKPDGSVVILYHIQGSGDSIENNLRDNGLDGMPIVPISDNDFPPNRIDRKYWFHSPIGKKIGIDSIKKSQDESDRLAQKTKKETDKQAALLKFCSTCTNQDLKDLLN